MDSVLCDASAFSVWRTPPLVRELAELSLGNKGLPVSFDRLREVRGVLMRELDLWRCSTFYLDRGRPLSEDSEGIGLNAGALAPSVSMPVDVLVDAPGARRSSRLLRPHVLSPALSEGEVVPLAHRLLLTSPALTLLQLASRLSLPRLVMAASEFCGSFSVYRPQMPCASSSRRSPPIPACRSWVVGDRRLTRRGTSRTSGLGPRSRRPTSSAPSPSEPRVDGAVGRFPVRPSSWFRMPPLPSRCKRACCSEWIRSSAGRGMAALRITDGSLLTLARRALRVRASATVTCSGRRRTAADRSTSSVRARRSMRVIDRGSRMPIVPSRCRAWASRFCSSRMPRSRASIVPTRSHRRWQRSWMVRWCREPTSFSPAGQSCGARSLSTSVTCSRGLAAPLCRVHEKIDIRGNYFNAVCSPTGKTRRFARFFLAAHQSFRALDDKGAPRLGEKDVRPKLACDKQVTAP